MSYTVFNSSGEAVAGDGVLDDIVKRAADQVQGWVENDEGELVYDSPVHAAKG